jgi:hypothetical protein
MIIEEIKSREIICCGNSGFLMCQGKACAAWCWAPIKLNLVEALANALSRSTTHGYCGLAGAP